jgi:hypothetical protein
VQVTAQPPETAQTTQQFLARHTHELLAGPRGIIVAISDLSTQELNTRPHEAANSIGFDAWHVFRTADNVVHFVFHREQPIWLQQGLDTAWGLPRVAQGTGMETAEAHQLRFPDPELLARYGHGVADAVCPRIEAMTDAFLAEVTRVQPHGELTRLDAIARTILVHGAVHLGQINLARTLLGKPSLDF